MRWQGRRGSSNVEDRRGMSTRGIATGSGIGIVGFVAIYLIVRLLGGDPSQVLQQIQEGTEVQSSTTFETSAEEDAMAQFVSVVLADTEDVWKKLFEESGSAYREPSLVLFRDATQSACGYATGASGPFYCAADEKVYIDLAFCDDLVNKLGAYGDFAVAYVIAHEVGHHVQNLVGTLDQVNQQRSRLNERKANQLTVSLELQADFLAGMWAHHAQEMLNILEAGDIEEALNAAAAVGDDAIQMKYQGRVVPDSFTHGTSEQRREWFRKGWETGDYSQGDTFSRL
jgi:predicted metalloprotease